jgi:uncharacterized protein DUF6049
MWFRLRLGAAGRAGLCLLLGGFLIGAAPQPTPGPLLRATLTAFPEWVGPGDALKIGLEVLNRGGDAATGLKVGISIYEGVGNRSELERSFKGKFGPVVGSDTLVVTSTVGAGESLPFTVEKPLSEMAFFRSGPDDRAYPVRITVRSDTAAAAPIDTHMIFFSHPAATPLGVALIVKLHAPGVYANDGARVSAPALERAFGNGRLATILSGLEAHPDLPVTIAPTGQLLDELSDLSDGFAQAPGGQSPVGKSDAPAAAAASLLDRIRLLVHRPAVRTIASPYSEAFLPGLVHAGMVEAATAQAGETVLRIRDTLGAEPLPGWLLPSPPLLDEPTLAALQRSQVTGVVVSQESVVTRPAVLTPASPLKVRTRTGALVNAIEQDPGLATRLASPGPGPLEELQRFLAETATTMLERPSLPRAVVVSTPADWAPDPRLIEGVLTALATAPWMRATTPEAIVSGVPSASSAEPAPTQAVLAAGPPAPPSDYFSALREGRRDIDRYADLSPGPARLAPLENRLLQAAGAEWWDGKAQAERGRMLAGSVHDYVRGEFAKIHAPASQTITLTSRSGVIPVVVTSQAGYPVEVVIRLDSDKLRFPGGSVIRQRLQPRPQTIDVKVIAQATGTFPLKVSIETPTGQIPIATSNLIIRSTAYDVVAVWITVGAGVTMVGAWIAGILRRRRAAA